MARLPKARYTREFRVHAVSMARNEGLGIAETARRLSISSKTLANWVKQVQQGQDFTKHNAVSEADAENSRLRKENARLRMECEILKKATAAGGARLSFTGCLCPKPPKGTNGQGGIDWRPSLTTHVTKFRVCRSKMDLAKTRIFLSVKSAALFCAQAMACSDMSQPMTRSPGKDCVKKPFPQPMSSTLA
jgi:Transposase and inactivated derivatives